MPSLLRIINLFVGQLAGNALGNNALPGNVGETISSTIAKGSAVSLTSTVTANITSINLTVGDWDVSGTSWFTGGGTTTLAFLDGGIGSSLTFPASGGAGFSSLVYTGSPTVFANGDVGFALSEQRFSVTPAGLSLFLVANASFGVGTCSGFGTIFARRRR